MEESLNNFIMYYKQALHYQESYSGVCIMDLIHDSERCCRWEVLHVPIRSANGKSACCSYHLNDFTLRPNSSFFRRYQVITRLLRDQNRRQIQSPILFKTKWRRRSRLRRISSESRFLGRPLRICPWTTVASTIRHPLGSAPWIHNSSCTRTWCFRTTISCKEMLILNPILDAASERAC